MSRCLIREQVPQASPEFIESMDASGLKPVKRLPHLPNQIEGFHFASFASSAMGSSTVLIS